ncbi:MAG: PilT/PilU family type 4a pilus ATPase [Deltaproteobacteria bacterium]|nr:PilT/PilU family type 4a pilus ATPase [Deltaproteobacteria bacterium]
MKAIDSVLRLLVEQGGTELRLASGSQPRMFCDGAPLPLTMPPTSTERIRFLLDDLWSSHAETLEKTGRIALPYRSAQLGDFAVRLVQPDAATLEVTFRREAELSDTEVEIRTPSAAPVAAPERRDTSAAGALPEALHALLALALARGASDIHLTPGQAPIARIDGELVGLDGAAAVEVDALLASPAQRERIAAGGSVDRGVDLPGLGRLRVNVYASDAGLCAALRLLRREAPPLAELNLPAQVAPLVELPHGLVIVCGPTGSGKSTTLAALAQHAMRGRAQVLVTLEDPIEYLIRPLQPAGLVRQREVGTHVRDFATGLRDALREDPDALLIGEMRDAETIGLALTAAETGHLVFASLHSRTAASAVERIVDTYPPERQRQIRVQLADALRAVIAQRLLPASDGGRVPAVELLRVTYAVANLIRDGRTAQIVNQLQAGGGEGMLVLERHLTDLVRAGRIRRDVALAAANDAATLMDYLK